MLSQETINQIAAGEVIERPASIVKELVENAIDAGASMIHIEIREGGISYIRVTDNGSGIPADQIRLAFKRHSTSKIRDAGDLTNIGSLGFRGEALASIAAVSRVEVLTRTPSSITGTRYVIEGGEEKRMEEIAAPVGTTFRVENLFFNTPVRKKFLKKENAEASAVSDYVQRMVMGHPEISFRFVRNGKEPSIHSPGNNQLKNSIFAVYGKDVLSEMVEVRADGPVRIRGYISKPQQTRASRNYENYYLNGRYIRSKIIENAIDDAYRDYVVPGTFPVVVLQIDMDPAELDVNVHPTKMQVRFTREHDVGTLLYEVLLSRLKELDLTARLSGAAQLKPATEEIAPATPVMPPAGAVSISRPEMLVQPEELQPAVSQTSYVQEEILVPQQVPETHILKESPASYETGPQTAPIPQEMRLVGQLFRTFWIAEQGETAYLIDQHAAHERVLYDRLKEKLSKGNLDAQILLEPLIVTLAPQAYQRVMEEKAVFERLGYSIDSFGEDSVIIREVPYIFNGGLGQEDFQTMVDLLLEGTRRVDQTVLIDRMATISCKAAIKGNDAISFEEMQSLLEQLMASPNPYNCPHGRPTMLTMTHQELDHRFKRS